jgi:hypothetical protein
LQYVLCRTRRISCQAGSPPHYIVPALATGAMEVIITICLVVRGVMLGGRAGSHCSDKYYIADDDDGLWR